MVWSAALALTGAYVLTASTAPVWPCVLVESAVYGEPSASWLPPGVTCTYTFEVGGSTGVVVERPSPVGLIPVAMAVTGLPVLLYLRRLLRRSVPQQPPWQAVGHP